MQPSVKIFGTQADTLTYSSNLKATVSPSLLYSNFFTMLHPSWSAWSIPDDSPRINRQLPSLQGWFFFLSWKQFEFVHGPETPTRLGGRCVRLVVR